MQDFHRPYPRFALCGLNCGLCPRYHTEGSSRCPGCGGPDFSKQHPTCAVATCNQKHDNVEYCFQCSAYPCKKYAKESAKDSFISYQNVQADFAKAQNGGLATYQAELDEKVAILETLLARYNDGRRKNFYCLALNLLPLADIRGIMIEVNEDTAVKDIAAMFNAKAAERGIDLRLRK